MRLSPVSRPLAIRRHSRAIVDVRPFTTSRPQFEAPKPDNSDLTPSSSSISSLKSSYSELFDSLRTSALTQAQNISALANEHITRLQVREKLGALGERLNEVTGYEEIERLKDEVTDKGESPAMHNLSRAQSVDYDQEAALLNARASAREAKAAYEAAVNARSSSQVCPTHCFGDANGRSSRIAA
jgi:hypothetical protein